MSFLARPSTKFAARIAAASAMATLFAAFGAQASVDNRRFELINHSNQDIVEFHASHVYDRFYHGDLLGNYVVPVGYSLTVNPGDGLDGCSYDFKTVMRDGEILYKNNVNVCVLETYTITSH